MITKEQALRECVLLWNLLAVTAHEQKLVDKDDIPGPWQQYSQNCPCCEYVFGLIVKEEPSMEIEEVGYCCRACPMFKQWMHYCNSDSVEDFVRDERYVCLYEKSPFTQWSDIVEMGFSGMLWYDLEFFCLLIVELAEEALNENTDMA